MGHFGCCCRGTPTKQGGGQGKGQGKGGKQKQVSCKKACVAEKTGDTTGGIFGTIQLDRMGLSTPFSFHAELDSGSQCTAITHSMFRQSFPHDVLQQPTETLHNFDGSLITCVHSFFLSKARFTDRMHQAEIYVLDDTCEPVIGWDLMIGLDMQVNCDAKRVHRAKDSKEMTPVVGVLGTEAGPA